MKLINSLKKILFGEEYDIQHKLLNVTLISIFFASIVCLIISVIIDLFAIANLLIILVILIVSLGIYFSVVKKKTTTALIITCLVDLVFFPAMYFTSGGMSSGMTIWFIVSLIIFWLILKKPYCYIMYIVNAAILTSCFVIELNFPELVRPIETKTAVAIDIIQCMLVVSALIGVIFKYQTTIYEKQKENLRQQTIELRETMLALERANEAKNSFLANMSHEIRTPINAIMGMNEIILRESKEDKTLEYADDIKRSSKLLLEFVDSMLDYSKMESGTLEIEELTYKTKDLVRSVNKMIKPKLARKGLEYKLTIDSDIPENLIGDNFKIIRVATHLLSNAVKYTEKGYIAFTVGHEKNADPDYVDIVMSVADTGVGIREENLENLFSGFNRIDIDKHRSIEGIGMGLAVTKKLVEMMGGTITAMSVYGSGSMFTVKIPQKIAPATKAETQEEIIIDRNFIAPHAKILAVDDNKINLQVINHILRKYKIRTDVAISGTECIELCKRNSYDLILMDHMMPAPDGIETLKIIRETDNFNRETPVAVLTANAVKGAREEYLKEGFSDYLSKPIDIKQLEKTLVKLLPDSLVEYENDTDEDADFSVDEWIDHKKGLRSFSGNKDIYNDILLTYRGQLKKYRDILPMYVEKSDWKNYTIVMHSIKSSSANINAYKFSEMSKEQEIYGSQENSEKIRETFDSFISSSDKMLRAIDIILG